MRFKTTAGFVVIIAGVFMCSIWTLLTLARNSAELESTQLLGNVADKVAAAMKLQDLKARKAALEVIAGSTDVSERNISIVVVNRADADRDRRQGIQRALTAKDILWKSRAQIPPLPPRRTRSGQESPEFAEWIKNWKSSIRSWGVGPGKLVLTIRPNAGVVREMEKRRLDMLLMGGLAVLAVGIGSWFVVGYTLSPIRKLAQQAASASAENLHVRLEPPSNDAEVIGLVDTLNGFLQRMAQTAESKGRFYAAASHELRTPLQALSGHLELALSRERPAEEYKAALEEAKKQSGRLKSLVQSLLLLHQLENNADRERDHVDVSAVCRTTIQQFQGLADTRSVALSTDLPADCLVSAISNHTEILVRNLVENAVKYATPGKRIELKLRTSANGVELTVYNECEPIPGWTQEKVFEAFYRPDSARNARTGGNGLGLAICRAIANADGWELRVEQVESGFLATVLFDAKPSAVEPAPKRRSREKGMGAPLPETPIA